MADVQIFIKDVAGKQHGPYSVAKIQSMIYQGRLSKTQLVRRADSGQWCQAKDLLVRVFAAVEQQKRSQTQNVAKTPTEVQVFIKDVAGKQYGPYSVAQIESMIYQGKLSKTQLVRRSDSGQWCQAKDLLVKVFAAVEHKKKRTQRKKATPPPTIQKQSKKITKQKDFFKLSRVARNPKKR